MIKEVRLKFIYITMISLILLLVALLLSTNLIIQGNMDDYTSGMLKDLAENEGVPPLQLRGKSEGDKTNAIINFAAVKLDESNRIIEVIDHNNLIANMDTEILISRIISSAETLSVIDQMKYFKQDKPYGSIIIMVDHGMQSIMYNELGSTSVIVGIVSILVLLVFVIFLSKLVIKPVDIAFEKQKRFIADSSHELKTPLTILNANAYMLKNDIGHNEWLEEMTLQTNKMRHLVGELLTLAKTDNMNLDSERQVFDLSKRLQTTLLSFDVVAFESRKEINSKIEEGIRYKGNEGAMEQMVSALMDNAIKYARDNTTIDVQLYLKANNPIIEIKNHCDGISQDEQSKIFDKFYRMDPSRNDSIEGYGLGLSIVKNIVDLHHGKIDVQTRKGDYVVFKVSL